MFDRTEIPTDREGESERSSIQKDYSLNIPSKQDWFRLKPVARNSIEGKAHGCQGSKNLSHDLLSSQTHWQGASWESEMPGLVWHLISDAGVASGSFTCCSTISMTHQYSKFSYPYLNPVNDPNDSDDLFPGSYQKSKLGTESDYTKISLHFSYGSLGKDWLAVNEIWWILVNGM